MEKERDEKSNSGEWTVMDDDKFVEKCKKIADSIETWRSHREDERQKMFNLEMMFKGKEHLINEPSLYQPNSTKGKNHPIAESSSSQWTSTQGQNHPIAESSSSQWTSTQGQNHATAEGPPLPSDAAFYKYIIAKNNLEAAKEREVYYKKREADLETRKQNSVNEQMWKKMMNMWNWRDEDKFTREMSNYNRDKQIISRLRRAEGRSVERLTGEMVDAATASSRLNIIDGSQYPPIGPPPAGWFTTTATPDNSSMANDNSSTTATSDNSPIANDNSSTTATFDNSSMANNNSSSSNKGKGKAIYDDSSMANDNSSSSKGKGKAIYDDSSMANDNSSSSNKGKGKRND